VTSPGGYEDVNVAFSGAEDLLNILVGDSGSRGRHKNSARVRTNSGLGAALKTCRSPIYRHSRGKVS